MTLFTTPLCILYPPLKGFSHRSDSHIRVYRALLQSLSRGIKPKGLDFEFACKMWA